MVGSPCYGVTSRSFCDDNHPPDRRVENQRTVAPIGLTAHQRSFKLWM